MHETRGDSMTGKKVAVIGAGAAGLVTARELQRAGHEPVVFEKGSTVGGVWVYSPQTEADPLGQSGPRIHGSLYASLRTNLPRDLMAFVDYPFDGSGGGDDAWPRFPGHICVRRYLERFAGDFGIAPLIRFETEVTAVRPSPGGAWTVESATANALRHETFDAIAVCNGHYAEPRIPTLPGEAEFPALRMHSHNYREPARFAGQRVALFGASASANDLAVEIAQLATELFCCGDAFAALPAAARDQGNLHRRPGIAALRPDGSLVLNDGSRVAPVDSLVYCTGYHYRYPFMPSDLLRVEDNWVQPLYHDLLHADHPSLAFIGIPFRVVPFPLFEVQARWFAKVVSQAFVLPDRTARHQAIIARAEALRAAGTKQRHFHQRNLDCYDYLDTLADQSGSPRIPGWHRQLTAALMAHAAAHPGIYRDRPLPHFGPTRVPANSVL